MYSLPAGIHSNGDTRVQKNPRGQSWRLGGDNVSRSHVDLSDRSWTLYVGGGVEAALWDFDAAKYWQGEFEIPAATLRSTPGR